LAIQEDNIRKVLDLLSKGVDPNLPISRGFTALQLCAQRDDHILAEILLLKGADPNVMDRRGRTALELALMRLNGRTATTLLMHGANVNDLVRFMLKYVSKVVMRDDGPYRKSDIHIPPAVATCLKKMADEGDEKLQDSFIAALERLDPDEQLQFRRLLAASDIGFDFANEFDGEDDGQDTSTIAGPGTESDLTVGVETSWPPRAPSFNQREESDPSSLEEINPASSLSPPTPTTPTATVWAQEQVTAFDSEDPQSSPEELLFDAVRRSRSSVKRKPVPQFTLLDPFTTTMERSKSADAAYSDKIVLDPLVDVLHRPDVQLQVPVT
jgi:hypothetical protein